MKPNQTRGLYLVKPEDAPAIQRLASDSAIAEMTRIPHPYPPNGAREFIARQLQERAEGTAYVFVIKDQKEVVGTCGLHGIERNCAREVGYWVGREYWGRGYATFGVRQTLEFAFLNLELDRVGSCAFVSNLASRRVLEKCGFQLLRIGPSEDPLLKRPHEHVAVYELTQANWKKFRHAPILATLHPSLKSILDSELAAGNEIKETGVGWGAPDGLYVRLRDPFKTKPPRLPAGVKYTVLNDPHWWKADYSTKQPAHTLAC